MKTILLILFTAIFSVTISSCTDDFLDIDPKGRILAKELVDYRNLFYSNALLSNGFSDVQQPLGDDVAAFTNYLTTEAEYVQRAFKWEADLYNDDQNAREFTDLTSQVYLLNKIITEVPFAEGGTEAEKVALIAEGRATRAWHYFMLINYYGKPYVAQTASSDPGFPIITVADASVEKFERRSVQEVYDFIIKDLLESIPFLSQNTDVRTRITKASAQAMLGKVYLFMGRYNEAIPLFNQALTNLPTSFDVGLYDYRQTLAPGGAWYFAPTVNNYIGAPLPWASRESLFSRQILSLWIHSSNVLVLNPETYGLFNSQDKRLAFFTRRPNMAAAGTEFPVPNVYRKFAPSNAISYGITMPDLYLMQAECEARSGDIDRALSALNTLRSKRTTEAEVRISDRTELIKFIIDERRREFAMHGFRWFDMRRLSVDPLFEGTTYTHVLYNQDGSENSRYHLPQERLTLRLPSKVLLFNPGMPDNP